MLDEGRRKRIPAARMVCSSTMSEFQEMQRQDKLEHKVLAQNWFSCECAHRVYQIYLDLDQDGDGLLSVFELLRFGSRMLSPLFISCLFQEVNTYGGLLDFKSYLDFVLAMWNPGSRPAIKYFWRVIDYKKKGYLDADSIRPFISQILKTLHSARVGDYSSFDPHAIVSELMDMVGCYQGVGGNPPCVHLQDLLMHSQGGVFLHVLVDAMAFWRYDNRESLLHQNEES